MADINVERRGPSIWPWIIGLIVLALLIWALVEMFGNRSEPVIADPEPDTVTRIAPTAPPAAPVMMDTAAPIGTMTDTIPTGTQAPGQPGTAAPGTGQPGATTPPGTTQPGQTPAPTGANPG